MDVRWPDYLLQILRNETNILKAFREKKLIICLTI